MELLILMLVVAALILGGIAGRSYERNLWQQRLLSRFEPDEPNRIAEALGNVRGSSQLEPAQLVQALDAIAVEVERIGEGQRFLTRIIAERDPRHWSGGAT